jgi:hypothetical protein
MGLGDHRYILMSLNELKMLRYGAGGILFASPTFDGNEDLSFETPVFIKKILNS